MLEHQIIAGKARWGPSLLSYGEFSYIFLYWEWMERVLAGFDEHLTDCSLYQVVYASLNSYSREAYVFAYFP